MERESQNPWLKHFARHQSHNVVRTRRQPNGIRVSPWRSELHAELESHRLRNIVQNSVERSVSSGHVGSVGMAGSRSRPSIAFQHPSAAVIEAKDAYQRALETQAFVAPDSLAPSSPDGAQNLSQEEFEACAPQREVLARLRNELDAALADTAEAREDASQAEKEALAELTRTVWPSLSCGLCARAIVLHVLKATAAVRNATAALESRAYENHNAYTDAAADQFSRAATSCRLLDAERATSEASLLRELRSAEVQIEELAREVLVTREVLGTQVRAAEERAVALEADRAALEGKVGLSESAMQEAQAAAAATAEKLAAIEAELKAAHVEGEKAEVGHAGACCHA